MVNIANCFSMLFLYNPSCEMAIRADGKSYTPPPIIDKMEHNMACLVMFLCNTPSSLAPDGVIMPSGAAMPDEDLLNTWFGNTCQCPRFVSIDAARAAVAAGEKFAPWGGSRAAYNLMGLQTEANSWNKRQLMSRATSVAIEAKACQIIRDLQNKGHEPAFWMEERQGSELTATMKDVEYRLAQNGSLQIYTVIKRLWSSSGRGVMFFGPKEFAEAMRYVSTSIKADGMVVCEPKFRRMAEVSFLLHFDGEQAVYRGFNIYESSANGTFGHELHGAEAEAPFVKNLGRSWDTEAAQVLCRAVTEVLKGSGYVGPLGIDAMLEKGTVADSKPKLRLCMEANIRHCMGHVANGIKPHFGSRTNVVWQMGRFGEKGQWDAFCQEESTKAPLRRNDEGKICSGFFRLTPRGTDVMFGAYGWVR